MKKILVYLLIFMLCFVSLSSAFAYEDASIKAVAKNEIEPNNSISQAQAINQDDTIYGKISAVSDVDYYVVTIPEKGKVNFWLGDIPNGCDYNLHVYNSSGSLLYSSTTSNSQELIENKDISKNTKLYIKISSVNGYSNSIKYKLRVKVYLNNYTFFCQKQTSDSFNFYDTNINNTYLKYYWDGKYQIFNFAEDIIVAGCALSSYAMVLNNLGCYTTTSYKDIRYGGISATNATRIADPISVAYANVNYPVAENYAGNPGKYLLNCNGSPVNMNFRTVATKFGVTNQSIDLSGLTDTEKKNHLAYYLTLHPEGVCAMFEKSATDTHMIVFTNTLYEVPMGFIPSRARATVSDEDLKIYQPTTVEEIERYNSRYNMTSARAITSDGDKFTVYDPARITDGGVNLSQSWTGGYYSWSNLSYLCVINN